MYFNAGKLCYKWSRREGLYTQKLYWALLQLIKSLSSSGIRKKNEGEKCFRFFFLYVFDIKLNMQKVVQKQKLASTYEDCHSVALTTIKQLVLVSTISTQDNNEKLFKQRMPDKQVPARTSAQEIQQSSHHSSLKEVFNCFSML